MNPATDYNDLTVTWADGHRYSPAPRHRRRLILNMIRQLSFKSCLDAGCAQPNLLEELSKGGKELYGCDISQKVIAANKEILKVVSFEAFDITKNTYPANKTFDLVISSEVIEHVDDWRSAVKNLCAMSNKYLLITVPSGKLQAIDRMIGHIRHYKAEELSQEIEKNSFKVTLSRYWGYPMHSLYKFAVNDVAPEKIYESFGSGKYSPSKKFICNVLYYLFYINDLFASGRQLILLAERKT